MMAFRTAHLITKYIVVLLDFDIGEKPQKQATFGLNQKWPATNLFLA